MLKTENDEEMQGLFQPETLEAVQKDYDYLQKMKNMDMEISLKEKEEGEGDGEGKKKGLEMTDVVPVGGLIMARLFFFVLLILNVKSH